MARFRISMKVKQLAVSIDPDTPCGFAVRSLPLSDGEVKDG